MSVARPFSPQTKVVRAGILAALAQGDASAREIEERMGFKPATATLMHLRNLERQGLVRQAGRGVWRSHRHFSRVIVWALVPEVTEAAA